MIGMNDTLLKRRKAEYSRSFKKMKDKDKAFIQLKKRNEMYYKNGILNTSEFVHLDAYILRIFIGSDNYDKIIDEIME